MSPNLEYFSTRIRTKISALPPLGEDVTLGGTPVLSLHTAGNLPPLVEVLIVFLLFLDSPRYDLLHLAPVRASKEFS